MRSDRSRYASGRAHQQMDLDAKDGGEQPRQESACRGWAQAFIKASTMCFATQDVLRLGRDAIGERSRWDGRDTMATTNVMPMMARWLGEKPLHGY